MNSNFEDVIERVSNVLEKFNIKTEIKQRPYVDVYYAFKDFSREAYELYFQLEDKITRTRYGQTLFYDKYFYNNNDYVDSQMIYTVLSKFSKMLLEGEKLAEIVLEN